MRHTLLLAGRFLTASLLLAIGFGAYGCGDSATMNPAVELASLTVSPGTLQPGFSGGTTQYRVDVTTDVTAVTVTAQAAVAGDAVTIDGQRTTSRSITLDLPGSTTVINIVVSESDTNSRTYILRVVRANLAGNNSLESLTVSPGTLAPTFDENLQSYTASVDNNVGSVTVTPTLSDTAATMTVNGQATNSGQARTITLNAGGQSTTITIIVTAQNGNSKTYVVAVSRGRSNNNNLQGLGISPGTLSPAFRAGTTGYTVNLPATLANNVTNVTVTPRLQDTAATMSVNGQTTNSGQARTTPIPAPDSNTFINIVVVAQDGTPKTYTVNVIRAPLGGNNNLSGLTVSPGPLAPGFAAATTNYTVNVASTVTSITVTPTRQDSNATITVNGQVATSGQGRSIQLNGAGSNTLINIVVTAPNGSQQTYTVNAVRAALGGNNNLRSLTVSQGTLSPAFSTNMTAYTVDVGSGVASISVTPTLSDPAATMTVNGQAATSGQAPTITLRAAGLSTVINVVVTAPNGTPRTYSVTVDRAALGGNTNLQGLTISPGTLSPVFNTARTAYTVGVGSSDTSITVTATPQDPSASVTINGQGPNSRSIPLPGGPASTEIEVRVIAPNGTDKTYLITVNQPAPAAPPAPASAPDLTPQSDSCPLLAPPDPLNPNLCAPGTSREDNITNVNTPSFRIPPPGGGETASLYVDGNKVQDAIFDSATNIFTLTTALSDGGHRITSTVTNAANLESPQSDPPLEVTIDTGAPGTPSP